MITGIKYNRTIRAKMIMRDGEKLEQQGSNSKAIKVLVGSQWSSTNRTPFFQLYVNFSEA